MSLANNIDFRICSSEKLFATICVYAQNFQLEYIDWGKKTALRKSGHKTYYVLAVLWVFSNLYKPCERHKWKQYETLTKYWKSHLKKKQKMTLTNQEQENGQATDINSTAPGILLGKPLNPTTSFRNVYRSLEVLWEVLWK